MNAVEDSSEQVHNSIQESVSAKVFPVIAICHGCHLGE
jgi:hypothetical protein